MAFERFNGSIVCLSALLIAFSASISGQELDQRSDDDLLLLALSIGPQVTSGAIPAYQSGDDVLVPLGELARILSLAIEVDPAAGHASGFIISEDRQFRLSRQQGTVTVGEEVRPLPETVEFLVDDIYVPSRVLESWWPVEIEPNLRRLILRIVPTELLPFQLRQQRQGRRPAGLDRRQLLYPIRADPYQWYQVPMLTAEVRGTVGDLSEDELFFTLAGAGDLGRATAQFFASGSTEGGVNAAGTVGRRDPNGELLGPLRATVVEAGEISVSSRDLLLQTATGTGARISNIPLYLRDQGSTHTIRGLLPQGWEVELYRNGALLEVVRRSEDGFYEFRDIPLLSGVNRFRLVFYGPRGEVREEVQLLNVLERLPLAGQFWYRVSAIDANVLEDRAVAEFSYGVNDRLAVDASLIGLERRGDDSSVDETASQLATFGARGSWRNTFLRGWMAATDSGEEVVFAEAIRPLGRFDFALSHAELGTFDSDAIQETFGDVTARSTFSVQSLRPLSRRVPVNFSAFFRRDELRESGTGYRLDGRVSSSFLGRYFFTTRIEREWSTREGTQNRSLANFLLSRFSGRYGVRAQANLAIEPEWSVQNYSINADYRLTPDLTLLAQLDLPGSDSPNRLTLTARRRGFEIDYGGGIVVDDDGNWGLTALVSTTAFLSPTAEKPVFRSRISVPAAVVVATVFIDENGDGELTAEEERIEGAEFFVDRFSWREATNDRGEIYISGLAPDRPVEISLSRSSLPNPLMIPVAEGIAVLPRAGRVREVSFPVIFSGAVTGTVYDDQGSPAAGAVVRLLSGEEEILRTTRSAFDGFYEFVDVPSGHYQIVAARGELRGSRAVRIPPTGEYLDGMDIRLGEE